MNLIQVPRMIFALLVLLVLGLLLTAVSILNRELALSEEIGQVIAAMPHVELEPGIDTAVSNPTLTSITTLLASPAGATIAWVHFLAFDLFVARWVYLDSRSRHIPPWFISPVLFFVLMLGPVGFLLYLVGRTAVARQVGPTVSADAHSGL